MSPTDQEILSWYQAWHSAISHWSREEAFCGFAEASRPLCLALVKRNGALALFSEAEINQERLLTLHRVLLQYDPAYKVPLGAFLQLCWRQRLMCILARERAHRYRYLWCAPEEIEYISDRYAHGISADPGRNGVSAYF